MDLESNMAKSLNISMNELYMIQRFIRNNRLNVMHVSQIRPLYIAVGKHLGYIK